MRFIFLLRCLCLNYAHSSALLRISFHTAAYLHDTEYLANYVVLSASQCDGAPDSIANFKHKISVQSHVNQIQWTIVIFQFVTFVYIFSLKKKKTEKKRGFVLFRFVLFRFVLCMKRIAFLFHVVWCEHLRNDIVNRALQVQM